MRKQKNTVSRPVIQYAALLLISFLLSAVTAMLFIIIAGSTVSAVISFFCAAVLCLLPAVAAKSYCVFRRLRNKNELILLCFVGFILSLVFTFSYYVAHDYRMSVYRYMKQTEADEYYFAGYESYLEDYGGAEDFMKQMRSTPASIVLENMSEEKLSRLSAEDLAVINNESLWDYCGFDDILGSTPEDVAASMEAASKMSTYDFTFKYRGLHAKTTPYLMTHPKLLLSELSSMIVSPGSHSAHFAILVIFLLGQLFAHWMVQKRFDVTQDKQLVYISEPRKTSDK